MRRSGQYRAGEGEGVKGESPRRLPRQRASEPPQAANGERRRRERGAAGRRSAETSGPAKRARLPTPAKDGEAGRANHRAQGAAATQGEGTGVAGPQLPESRAGRRPACDDRSEPRRGEERGSWGRHRWWRGQSGPRRTPPHHRVPPSGESERRDARSASVGVAVAGPTAVKRRSCPRRTGLSGPGRSGVGETFDISPLLVARARCPQRREANPVRKRGFAHLRSVGFRVHA